MEITMEGAAITVASLVVTGVFGWFWFTLKNLNKKANESVNRKEVEKMIDDALASVKKDVAGVKDDTRAMADSVLQSTGSLEKRMDTLMLHLMSRNQK